MLTRSDKRPMVVADAKAHSRALGLPGIEVVDRPRAGTASVRRGRVEFYDFGAPMREHLVTIYDYEPHALGIEDFEGE